MTETAQIRRRPDGSIDIAHYLSEARVRRSEAAHEMTGAVTRTARKPLVGLSALLAVLPFIGGQG